MLSVELVVHFSDGWVEEGERSINSQLYQRDSSCLYEFDLSDPFLGLEQLLQSLQGSLYPFWLRQKVHEH